MDSFGVPGFDQLIHPSGRLRMDGQNRTRYLNSMVQATRTTAQTGLAVNAFTSIAFNATDLFDTDTLHDTVINNSRLTAAITGKYVVFGSVYVLNSGSAVAPLSSYLRISINGTLHNETGIPYDPGITGNIVAIADFVTLTAGQYVELQADMVATSGTFDVSASINPIFGMAYIGE